GGVIQTFLAGAGWATDRHRPERQALATAFRALATMARSPADPLGPPPASGEITTASTMLSDVMSRRDEVLPLRALLDEAERIRIELLALQSGGTPEGEGAGPLAGAREDMLCL